jgi:GNAT superfamily N-acetyltransferase
MVEPTLRLARMDDIPAIARLIELSARGLSEGFYSIAQVEALVRHVFGPDTRLIQDRTYYVMELDGRMIACGGWSRRDTLYGGDQMKSGEDPVLDPAQEPARIRAFFVHPEHARQGLGGRIFAQCLEAAEGAGFTSLTLMSTLPGEPLYRFLGFYVTERIAHPLPDGTTVPMVRMLRSIRPETA